MNRTEKANRKQETSKKKAEKNKHIKNNNRKQEISKKKKDSQGPS